MRLRNLAVPAAAACLVTLQGCAAAPPARSAKGAAIARLNYVELPVGDIGAARSFYEQAFGWSMTEFAPTYAATTTGDTDVGLDADPSEQTKAPLPVIEVQGLEDALASVERAGGTILRPIFSFPGGRRFHFRDPAGNEIAVWEAAAE